MAQPATVLVLAELDDAPRMALETACAAAGYSPSVESSAEVATTKLGAKRYDALIVHMGTPGAALACMKARGRLLRIRIPVIALADEEDDAAFARAYRAGADETLPTLRPALLAARLKALPKPTLPQPGNARGDAVVADADRNRAEVLERVLKDAGFRVDVALDGFATRLQAGRPSLKVAVVDASLEDVPALIAQARGKGSRCAWVARVRPELLDELRVKLRGLDRVAVVSAYGPPDDVLFETNRLLEARPSEGRSEARLLHGTILGLKWPKDGTQDVGYSYNVSSFGLYVRTLAVPPASDVEIDVVPPGGNLPVRLEGKVAWRREFGTTRKEPVPAGFGVRITGGDMDAWAAACPQALSVRPEMLVEAEEPKEAPPAKPRKPFAHLVTPPTPAVVAKPSPPVPVDPGPRAPLSSVEQMLESVLGSGARGPESGAAPLSIDGGTVVEVSRAPSPDAHTAETRRPPEAPEEPLEPEAVPTSAPPESPPPSTRRPSERPTVLAPESAPPREPPPVSVEAVEITAESLGFDPDEELGEEQPEPPRAPPSERPAPPSEPAPPPARVEPVAESLPLDPEERPSGPTRTDTPSAKAAKAATSGTSDAAELRVPTTGMPRWVWPAVVGAAAGAIFLVLMPRREAPPPAAAPPAPVAATSAAPKAAEPPPTAAPVPEEAPPAAVPVATAAAATAEPAPAPPAPGAAEADPAALAALPRGHGLLYVASPRSTNVYVYGHLVGTTNQAIQSKCGPRFVRLGTAPGAWQGEGAVHVVKCGAFTRVEMAGE